MLKNPFATENSSRVTASGFTDSSFASASDNTITVNDDEDGSPVNFIKYHGPVPRGYQIALRIWQDADNHVYHQEVLTKLDDYEVMDETSKKKKRSDSVVQQDQSDERTQVKFKDDRTILPDDSVTQIQPLRVQKQIYERSVNQSETGTCLYNNIVGGYGQTADEKLDELDAISKIQTVTGLPQIFVNSRLNFLIHLHKPLQEILSKDGQYPSPDSLWMLSDFMKKYRSTHRNPHRDLLFQVVHTTIKNDRVRANPFNLPLLEVGMYLNDKLIFISFSQLFQEYQIEWFRSMKDIEPPKFHNVYKGFSTKESYSRNSQQSTRRSKKSGSVISGFGF